LAMSGLRRAMGVGSVVRSVSGGGSLSGIVAAVVHQLMALAGTLRVLCHERGATSKADKGRGMVHELVVNAWGRRCGSRIASAIGVSSYVVIVCRLFDGGCSRDAL
jgi:hypothetical protein